MVMFMAALVAIAPIAAFATVEGAKTQAKAASPRLTEAQAIEIAMRVARKEGRDLNEYGRPEATYWATDRTWFVFFDGKANLIGNFFFVTVDDRKRTAELSPGR